jgi:chaperonin GroEL (HSP60 family)
MSLYAQEIFLIKSYEKKISTLKEENKNLEIEFSKTNSLSNLNEYLKDFEKVKNVKYIKLTGSSVAEK